MSISTLVLTAVLSISSANALWVPEKRAESSTSQKTSTKSYKTTRKATIKAAVESERTKTTTHKSPTSSIEFANAPTQHVTTSAKAVPTTTSGQKAISSITSIPSSHSLVTATQTNQASITHDNAPNYTQVASNSSSNDDKSSSSTSNGGLVGAVVATAAIVALALGAFLIFRKKKRTRYAAQRRLKPDPFTMGYGNQDFPPPLDTSFPPPSAYGIVESNDKPKPSASITALAPSPAIMNSSMHGLQSTTMSPSPVSAAPSVMTASTIPSIGKFIVIATYVPTLSDEIEIEPGDKVDLLVEYDDGWCQGINVTRGNIKGVFPRHCIDHVSVSSHRGSVATSIERSKRVSSMM